MIGPGMSCGRSSGDDTPVLPGDGASAGQPTHADTLAVFAGRNFSGAGHCATCHTALFDEGGHDVSIPTHWRSTMMANAAQDPFFLAKVSSETARNPHLREFIEDLCATCHMPMARTQAVADGAPVAIFDDGFLDPNHELHEAAQDGVSCTLCHQIQDVGLGSEQTFGGAYVIDTRSTAPDRFIFGPFPDPQQSAMRAEVGFVPVEGPQLLDSGLCATCHTLFTPVFDAQGGAIGQFPEQTPYLEWLHSEYGDGVGEDRSCQQCHMPEAQGAVPLAIIPPGQPPRAPFGQHHFVGGNAFMLKIFRENIRELGLTAGESEFDATLARTLAQLQNDTATLTIAEARLEGDDLIFDVFVECLTGHKFPTGYPSRRAWLHVRVVDAAGRIVFESGAADGDRIAGNNADENAAAFEPHYETITRPEEVQIYEAIMADSLGEVTYTVLDAARYLKDNRVLPAGFDKLSADGDIAPRGQAALDEDFVGGSDRVTYRVSGVGAVAPLTASVELLYQSIGHRFVEDLRRDGTPHVGVFARLYSVADLTPVGVAMAADAVVNLP